MRKKFYRLTALALSAVLLLGGLRQPDGRKYRDHKGCGRDDGRSSGNKGKRIKGGRRNGS